MRRRIHLLALLVIGGGAVFGPAPASATYKPPADLLEPPPANYCCQTFWGFYGCCGENGCRITSQRCEKW